MLPISIEAFFILPVIHALIVGQGDIHCRSIGGKRIAPLCMGLPRVGNAADAGRCLFGLIERREQQHQKGHIVVERKSLERAICMADLATQTAVAAAIPRQLLLGEKRSVCQDKAKHMRRIILSKSHLFYHIFREIQMNFSLTPGKCLFDDADWMIRTLME